MCECLLLLLVLGINNVKRIPDIDPAVIESLNRDWKDITELSECLGTEEIVLRLMTEFLFKIASLGAYGGKPMPEISPDKIKEINQDFKDISELRKE